MRLFLDANILIDILAERNLQETSVETLMPQIDAQRFYISTLSIHVAYYTLKIRHGSKLDLKMKSFLERINLVPLSEKVLLKALKINFNDFEDLLQYFSALEKCDYLLTRNVKDFRKIKTISPSNLAIISDLSEVF